MPDTNEESNDVSTPGLPGLGSRARQIARHFGTARTQIAPRPTNPDEDPTMTNLKAQVADREYAVDSALVAEEILRKLRLIKRARRELVSGPDQSPQPKLRGP